MGMDWEHFFKYGYNPAVESLQDFQKYAMQSNLSRQSHQQRMKEMGTEYGYRHEETDYTNLWRQKLARVNETIERGLVFDKDYLQNERLKLSNELMTGRQKQSFKNQKELANIYTQGSIKTAEVYKDIALIKNKMTGFSQFNPEGAADLNRTTWNNLLQNYQELTGDMQQFESEIGSILSDKWFSKVHSGAEIPVDSPEVSLYKEKYDQLVEKQKMMKEARGTLLGVSREIAKFAADAKISNPLTEQESMMAFDMIGLPRPAGDMKPQFGEGVTRGFDEHLKAIEYWVLNSLDLPTDVDMVQRGFDPNWMKGNWQQYREFYRTRYEQTLKDLYDKNLGGITDKTKKLGELLSTFFF